MKIFVSCLLLACIAFYDVSATKWEDCGSATGTVKSLQVSDCPDSDDTCILKRGTTKTITIEFDSKTASKTVKASVHGVMSGVPMPFPLPKADGCVYGGLSCPIQDGKSYTYSHSLDIKSIYPPVSVKVRWELVDEASKDIVCLEIPCEIQ